MGCSLKESEKIELMSKFKEWFRTNLSESHKRNTEKLVDPEEFQINPFLLYYLANYLEGNSNPETLAKVLVYPRVLGTSITTSFGTGLQSFISSDWFKAYGSTTQGIDIEFIDQTDGRRKYCQLKSGPNALNKDDIKTIVDHFKAVKNLAKTNNKTIALGDLVFALTYGERNELNAFTKALEDHDVKTLVGKEFWHALTGDANFYKSLIVAAGEVAQEFDMKSVVDSVIKKLSKRIESRFKEISE
ncbi:MAG: restriction endonuclease [Nitrospinae bacterium]|nr:restriction endonuclease [Nitrospinota bacterium]